MKNKEEILAEMDNGTEQEKKASQIARKLTFINIEEYMVGGIGLEDGKLCAFVNEETFNAVPDIVKKTILVEIAELVIGKYHIRGVGKETQLWNLSVSLEISCMYHHTIVGSLIPEVFNMETNLFAEEYYLLFQKKRDELEGNYDKGFGDFLYKSPPIEYNEELGLVIEEITGN